MNLDKTILYLILFLGIDLSLYPFLYHLSAFSLPQLGQFICSSSFEK